MGGAVGFYGEEWRLMGLFSSLHTGKHIISQTLSAYLCGMIFAYFLQCCWRSTALMFLLVFHRLCLLSLPFRDVQFFTHVSSIHLIFFHIANLSSKANSQCSALAVKYFGVVTLEMTHLVTMAACAWRWQITCKVLSWDWVESIQVDNERFALAAQGIVCSVWWVYVCEHGSMSMCGCVSFMPACVSVCWWAFRSSFWFQWTCLSTSLPISTDKPSVCPVHGVLFLERRRRKAEKGVKQWQGCDGE